MAKKIFETLDSNKDNLEKGKFADKQSKATVRVTQNETLNDTPEVKVTAITTSATRIETPDNCNDFTIFHKEDGETVYVGDENVTGPSDGIPLDAYEELEFKNMKKNDENNIYGIVSTGTVVIYAIGVYRE